MATAPDALLRLADHFDSNRKVFLSGDYRECQLRAKFLNGPCLTIPHSDFVIRTFPGPFFESLGRNVDMPADVLGQVYEQFLRKVIRLSPRRQAKVEERSKGPVSTRALDGLSATRRLSAMPCEPRPPLTEV